MFTTVPIPPAALISHVKDSHYMHFCLVQEMTGKPWSDQYVSHYQEIGNSSLNYLIMDNGAFEEGSSMPTYDLVFYAKMVNPQEIVLPDRMFRTKDTLQKSKYALAYLKDELWEGIQYQGVVQGRNHQEILDCAYGLFDMGVDIIGIPKDYEAWPGGRGVIIEMLTKIGLPIHLLGMEKNIWEFTKWRNIELVRSMDTAKPYIYTLNHEEMFDGLKIWSKLSRPDDYFGLTENDINLGFLDHNLERWQNARPEPVQV